MRFGLGMSGWNNDTNASGQAWDIGLLLAHLHQLLAEIAAFQQ